MSQTLETLLEKCTSGKNKEENWDAILSFCNVVKKDPVGPRDALQMILDRLHTKSEPVTLHTLTLLEACVKNCGPEMHAVVSKFKFLNELIKLVSPKYYSDTPIAVRDRILWLLQHWNYNLPDHPKVRDVYNMLKRQGLQFPQLDEVCARIPAGPAFLDIKETASTRPSPLEESNEKYARRLEVLLKSKDPKDLAKANRLIKKMYEKDAEKQERLAAFRREMESVNNNTKLLSDLLSNFNPSKGRLEDDEVIQQLLTSCKELRESLVKQANEMDEKEVNDLAEVLAAGDLITRVLDQYNSVQAKGASYKPGSSSEGARGTDDLLLDLFSAPKTLEEEFGGLSTTSASSASSASASMLASLASPMPATAFMPAQPSPFAAQPQFGYGGGAMPQPQFGYAAPMSPFQPAFGGAMAPMSPMAPLGGMAPMSPMAPMAPMAAPAPAPAPAAPALVPVVAPATPAAMSDPFSDLLSPRASAPATPAAPVADLLTPTVLTPTVMTPEPDVATLPITLESIQPGTFPPANVYDKNGLRVMLHFAKDSPHPNIIVAVASFLNFNAAPITNLVFQAKILKHQKIALRPPSSTECPAMNPMKGPSAVTQIVLVSNPTKDTIRIRYRLTYRFNGMDVVEDGECSNFPPMK